MASVHFSSGRVKSVAAALVLIIGTASAQEFIYDTSKTEANGGGFGNKWRDFTSGDIVTRDYDSPTVGDPAAGLYSMKVQYNQCAWRWWTAFSLHSVEPFVADDTTALFFRWGGNARAFKDLIIELEAKSDGAITGIKVPASAIDVPGNTDDLNKPWYISVPLNQFMGLTQNDEFDRLAFKVQYQDPEADEEVEFYMSDIFLGQLGERKPQGPIDTRNFNQFDIVSRDYIYDGASAVPPFFINSGWRDWSWGAIMPRIWNDKWKLSDGWVKIRVSTQCDPQNPPTEQALTLKSNAGIKVEAGTKMKFKYAGDWRDVELRLQNSQDSSMDTSLSLAGNGLPENWVSTDQFATAEIPLGSAANAKKYDVVQLVHTVPVSYERPGCGTYGSTWVHCQTIYIADWYTEG